METFLGKSAKFIYENYKDNIDKVCIVLPSKRAGLFLKRKLAETFKKTFWAPSIYSSEEFISITSGLTISDNLNILFAFYEVYCKIEKEKAQSFEDFLQWAPILLQDFNEIDMYLVKADQLYSYLNETRALEVWNPGQTELTDFQKQYLNFWKSLGIYYKELTAQLYESRQAYAGMAYRIASENTIEKVIKLKWDKVIFIGFNALNIAEEKIFAQLQKAELADFLWDVDSYYFNNKSQEAGRFLRKHSLSFKNIKELENLFATEEKKIHVIGTALQMGQAKVAGLILNEEEIAKDLEDTALVLADENLLLPVLNSLPESVKDVNITMGYPLKHSLLYNLSELLFNLHETAERSFAQTGKYKFYVKDVVKIFSHPYLKNSFYNNTLEEFKIYLIENNIVFVSPEIVIEHLKKVGAEKLILLFSNWNNKSEFAISSIMSFVELLKNSLLKQTLREKENELELEYLYQFVKIINTIKQLNKSYSFCSELKTLKSIVLQGLKSSTLPFYGEPLKGLQLMGMLETRTLDFKNVILISANEGVLPSAKSQNSFIPFDIKKEFKLPTHTDRDAIFAYHFYRLIQRAKNIYLVYNTETDEFGSGEKSRFISQLLHELPKSNSKVKIEESIFSYPVIKNNNSKEIAITKTEKVLDSILKKAQKGFSPSSLNVYKNCAVQFYFKYVAGINEQKEVEESIDAATMGIVIHKVLEEFYTPLIGKILRTGDLEQMIQSARKTTELVFHEKYGKENLYNGKNYLSLQVATRFIENFLKQESTFIKNLKGVPVSIKALEQELKYELEINGKKVVLKGNADRIDLVGNQLRIIDYKTGKVENKELKVEEIETIINDPGLNKSFQLLLYAYLYKKSHSEAKSVEAGIVTFRELSSGFKSVVVGDKGKNIDEDVIQKFEDQLKTILNNLLDPDEKFTQTENTEICSYCEYKGICGR